jgi:geranylgeranyl diphosphate synthase type I
MDLVLYVREVEREMQDLLQSPSISLKPFYGMMAYHLGWTDRDLQPAYVPAGKRFRPLLCLLVCQALGSDWHRALPAAAAIELLHNFSLIHDDIEDSSPLRRHRETVWHIWGVPQGINAGDGMHVLTHLALQRLREQVPVSTILDVMRILDDTCLRLCEGQYLDISFETCMDIGVEEYLEMIGGKSASLIAASTEIGAALATERAGIIKAYRQFGWEMGLAFQMVDDVLGIWGDSRTTGKSAASDILSKKKTLPILYALDRLRTTEPASEKALYKIYQQREISESDVERVLGLLDEAGARAEAQTRAEMHTARALAALARVGVDNAAQRELHEMAAAFAKRSS